MRRLFIPLFALAGFLAFGSSVQAQTVHEVKMVDVSLTEFAYEPASITVKPGDIVRWVNAGTLGQPHNVDFRAPMGLELSPDDSSGPGIVGTISPFLMAIGDTWEITIDERFIVGETQPYVCTPHEMMGMTGTITVEAQDEDPAR